MRVLRLFSCEVLVCQGVVTLLCSSIPLHAQDGEFINLADIVAGGDGRGLGGGANADRVFTAVNIDTGTFLTETEVEAFHRNTSDEDGINPSPVEESDSIDSVFFMSQDILPINSAEVEMTWEPGDPAAGSWNHILSNFVHQLDAGDRGIEAASRRDFETAIGIHAAAGVTFDLEAIREEHGKDAVHTFSTFAGMNSCGGCGAIRLYVIYSDEDEILEDDNAEVQPYWSLQLNLGEGEQYEGEIPSEARFLTLATGSLDGGICCDHGVFADPRILPCPEDVCPPGTPFLRGDSNADGERNLTDAVFTLSYLFGGGPKPPCLKAADANDTGTVDLTDSIYLLNFLFSGAAEPDAPFAACGPDPTLDELLCETFEACL